MVLAERRDENLIQEYGYLEQKNLDILQSGYLFMIKIPKITIDRVSEACIARSWFEHLQRWLLIGATLPSRSP